MSRFYGSLCIHGESAHEQHVRRTLILTLTHTITVSGNVVRVRILICATGQRPCRKRVYRPRL